MQGRSHLYIYDEFLADRKFERILSELEGRLSTLDLQGPIARLSSLRGTKELVTTMVRPGISTVVVVGDDATLDKVLWFLPELNLPVGLLGVRGPFEVSKKLGVPTGILGCDVLAARHVETFDLGKVNDQYFLSQVCFTKTSARVGIPGQYMMGSRQGADITISNLEGLSHDGLLDLAIRPWDKETRSWWSRSKVAVETKISLPEMWVEASENVRAVVDRHSVEGKAFHFKVIPGAIKFITGRRNKRVV